MSDEFSSSDALIGMRLGNCRIERLLGAGGMSAIYLAQQERPRRPVAIKVLQPHLLADTRQWPLFLARFRREADATAALDHANIVPIYEFGEQDDLAYLVMPYLPDGSLAALLSRQGTLSVAQTLNYVEQIAAALDYAHQHGIIHRDVKPSNLLLHPDGRLLLADFGIARPLDKRDLPNIALASDTRSSAGLTVSGVALGTPDYMAPEQIRGERVGPAADTYALGVVTYAMLAGHAPFSGAPTAEVLARQINDAPPPLRIARPDVPARFEEVVFWALAKDASERPKSAGAYAQALREGSDGLLGALWKRAAGQGTTLSAFRGAGAAAEVAAAGAAPLAALAAGGDATLYDPAFHGGASSNAPWTPQRSAEAAPAWPGARARAASVRLTRGGLSGPLMAAVGLALVALVVMAVVVASALGGSLAQMVNGGPGGAHGLIVGPTPTATLTPTPSPSPSPTPPAVLLSVSPKSISLSCSKSSKSATITLSNRGESQTSWSTQVSSNSSADNGGITLSRQDGDVGAESSVTVTVTNATSIFNDPSGVQGQITFGANGDSSGNPVVVTYTTKPCFIGG